MEQRGGKEWKQISSEDEMELRRGPWTVEEDFTLINYIAHHGEGRWNSLARSAGLKRTGKSCRLRWLNYLRPDVRRGNITLEEQLLILELHSRWGNRWSKIAQHLPGRTDNEIKNYWRTRVLKHAKQLKCDVNSKQFKDTMRYLWMPRLIERIQAAAAASSSSSSSSSSAATYQNNNIINSMGATQTMVQQQPQPNNMFPSQTPENSSAAASSESTDCNAINQNQDCFPIDQQSLTSPTHYFNQAGLDFIDQPNTQFQYWSMDMDGADNFWNVDDICFLHHQFNNNI